MKADIFTLLSFSIAFFGMFIQSEVNSYGLFCHIIILIINWASFLYSNETSLSSQSLFGVDFFFCVETKRLLYFLKTFLV